MHWWRIILLAILLVCLVAIVAAQAAADVKLIPTDRIPEANGKARLDADTLDVQLDGMKPAILFGGDYSTYVLWLLLPDGKARNMGEFALEGSHSRLVISTELKSFGILVTAEPHYRVTAPSRFVVLQSQVQGEEFPQISYRTSETPYNYERDTLEGILARKARFGPMCIRHWRHSASRSAPTPRNIWAASSTPFERLWTARCGWPGKRRPST